MAAQTPLHSSRYQLRDRMTKGEITLLGGHRRGYLDRIARYDAAPRVHRYLRRRGPLQYAAAAAMVFNIASACSTASRWR